MQNNSYQIIKLSFFGSEDIFSSENEKEIAQKLVEFGAYKQPIMMDAGYKLIHGDGFLCINTFVEENLTGSEIEAILLTHAITESDPLQSTTILLTSTWDEQLKRLIENGVDVVHVDFKSTKSFNPFANLSPKEILEITDAVNANCNTQNFFIKRENGNKND